MDEAVRTAWMKARPRFASDALARRVILRGEPMIVVQHPANGRHWRCTVALHRLVQLLDGRRTVADAMALAGVGDGAQGDTLLAALGGMAQAGLLRMPGARRAAGPEPLAASLKALLQRVIFARIPIGNLAPTMRVADPALGWLYTLGGMVLLVALIAAAAFASSSEGPAIAAQFERLGNLGPKNLAIAWLMFAATKMLHEIGHAVAVRRAGAAEGLDLTSFPWGVSFMFLMPAPYVDVSPSWLVADRWRRAQVGVAGIAVDLLVAAMAALAWAEVGEGVLADRLFDLVLVCGISSLLFNANPLVRLDGYYVLSDILEIPNLQTRSFLALRTIALSPLGLAERPIRASDLPLALYSAASWAWRWSVFIGVFWVAGGFSSTLAFGLAAVLSAVYVAIPVTRGLGRWAVLARRGARRAVVAPLVLGGAAGLLLFVPIRPHVVAEGIVWNDGVTWIFAPADGIVEDVARPGATAGGAVRLDNPELRRTLVQLRAEQEGLAIEARRARAETPAKADALGERQRAVAAQIAAIDAEMATWSVPVPRGAVWHPLRAETLTAAWVRRDDQRPLVVAVADGPLALRVVLDQWDGPAALDSLSGVGGGVVPVRRRGEAVASFQARLVQSPNQARDELPSQALSLSAGGDILVRADARGVLRPVERVFEVRFIPVDPPTDPPLRHGARVEVRIPLAEASLAAIGWRRLRQALQRHLEV